MFSKVTQHYAAKVKGIGFSSSVQGTIVWEKLKHGESELKVQLYGLPHPDDTTLEVRFNGRPVCFCQITAGIVIHRAKSSTGELAAIGKAGVTVSVFANHAMVGMGTLD